jgi:hypothetical protein
MPRYQATLTVWIDADDKDEAENLIDARVPVAYRVEQIHEVQPENEEAP